MTNTLSSQAPIDMSGASVIELNETIQVRRPIADCFRYLLDFSSIEQWDPGVYRADKLTPGPVWSGTEFALLLNVMGRHVPMRYQLQSVIADRELVLMGSGEDFRAVDTIAFRSLSSAITEINYRAVLEFSDRSAVAVNVLKPLMRRVGRKAVDGLKRALNPAATVPHLNWSQVLGDRLIVPGMWSFTERGYLAMPDKSLSEFMDGKTVVITGPTAGLGLAAAQMMSRLGAKLVLLGRDPQRMAEAVTQIRAFSGCSSSQVICHLGDLSRLADLRRLGVELEQRYTAIDVLIHNAGALFDQRQTTGDGFERTLAINLVAPYVLTRQLMPVLRASRARVINVVSGGMYTQAIDLNDMLYQAKPFNGAKAYARAKRGLMALTEHWATTETEIRFNAMHPGWAATPGVEKSLPDFNQSMQRFLRDSRMGADTMVWLASAACVSHSTGQLWFDRRPRRTALLPGARHDVRQREQLVEWLRREID